MNAGESACISLADAEVLHLFSVRSWTKVAWIVVCALPIAMVDLIDRPRSCFKREDNAVGYNLVPSYTNPEIPASIRRPGLFAGILGIEDRMASLSCKMMARAGPPKKLTTPDDEAFPQHLD
jgi:hypothetical protein